MRRYRKSRRYLSVDLKKNAKIFKTRVQIKELKTLHKTTREIKTLMRVMRVTNRITPMSARPQPKMQSKKCTKTAEPKRARHVHAIGQHHKLRIMAQTRRHNHHQRNSQNDKPGSARSRNHPRDSAQHRVRNPKRALRVLRGGYSRYRSCSGGSKWSRRTPRNMRISMLTGNLRRTLRGASRFGRRRKIRLLHCGLLHI